MRDVANVTFNTGWIHDLKIGKKAPSDITCKLIIRLREIDKIREFCIDLVIEDVLIRFVPRLMFTECDLDLPLQGPTALCGSVGCGKGIAHDGGSAVVGSFLFFPSSLLSFWHTKSRTSTEGV